MEKINLSKQFSIRLRDAMIAAGYTSHRSPSGVSIEKLAEITTYSVQICRKYLRGEALPDPMKIIDISTKLSVSPGWLLFGEHHPESPHPPQSISIHKNLLHYIFTQASELYNHHHLNEDIPDFLLSLTSEVSQINTDEEQSKKIIDLALSSAKHFKSS